MAEKEKDSHSVHSGSSVQSAMDDTQSNDSKSNTSKSQPHNFLANFFLALAHFQFDRAHEIAEKVKDTQDKSTNGAVLCSLSNILGQLCNAEKNYYSMSFIEKKLFKQTPRPLYANLRDLLKHEVGSSPPTVKAATKDGGSGKEADVLFVGDCAGAASPAESVEVLAREVTKQLNNFVAARLKMIDFYEFMAKSGWSHIQNTPEILSCIVEIRDEFGADFQHPVLAPIKTSFGHEVEIVLTLFQTEAHLSEWDFLPSLLALRESQSKLQSWSDLSPSSSSVKEQLLSTFSYKNFFTRSIKRQSDIPFLYEWLNKFYLQLVAKFTLYFYTALSGQASPTDMKATTAKTEVDFINKFTNFQKKSDGARISLVLDTNGKKNVYRGHGYHLDTTEHEPPTGLNSYPSVVSVPEGVMNTSQHWPNVISLITNKSEYPKNTDKVIYFYDPRLGSSYYCSKMDVRLYLVIIYESKKKERDNYIQTFLADIKAQLNHDSLYALLRPGQAKSF